MMGVDLVIQNLKNGIILILIKTSVKFKNVVVVVVVPIFIQKSSVL